MNTPRPSGEYDDDPYNIRSMFSEKTDAPPIAPPQAPVGVIAPLKNPMTIPDLLRAAMRERGISQKDLANQLSISEQYISDILAGKRSLSVYVALQIERVLGIDAEHLLTLQVRKKLAKARREFGRNG